SNGSNGVRRTPSAIRSAAASMSLSWTRSVIVRYSVSRGGSGSRAGWGYAPVTVVAARTVEGVFRQAPHSHHESRHQNGTVGELPGREGNPVTASGADERIGSSRGTRTRSWLSRDDCDLEEFRALVERPT